MKKKNKSVLRLEDDPILYQVAEPCEGSQSDRQSVGLRLLAVIKSIPKAVGLSAPQIGLSKRVVAIRWAQEYTLMYNPKIVLHGILHRRSKETCLSFSHRYVVWRPFWCVVQYEDDLGEKHKEFCRYRKARIVLHEVEHLDGKCINRGKEKEVYDKKGYTVSTT